MGQYYLIFLKYFFIIKYTTVNEEEGNRDANMKQVYTDNKSRRSSLVSRASFTVLFIYLE